MSYQLINNFLHPILPLFGGFSLTLSPFEGSGVVILDIEVLSVEADVEGDGTDVVVTAVDGIGGAVDKVGTTVDKVGATVGGAADELERMVVPLYIWLLDGFVIVSVPINAIFNWESVERQLASPIILLQAVSLVL